MQGACASIERRIGFAVSVVTIWRTAKRDGWVGVAEGTRPWLTDEQILARLQWAAGKLEQARRRKDPGYDEKNFRCFTRKRKTNKDPEWVAEDQ